MDGTVINQYAIRSLLGEGGMSKVYLGEHLENGQEVAVKVIHPTFLKMEEAKKRFNREIAIHEKMNHQNIVKVLDYIFKQGDYYLILEYVSGLSLSEYIPKVNAESDIDEIVAIFCGILDGLEYAHKQGVIHRDIKPSNILLTEDLQAKVMDFGIAKVMDNARFNLTQPGTQVGTLSYMSPEQVKGLSNIDHRTDIYSLGVTFFELVTGSKLYKGQTSRFKVCNKIISEPLPRLKEFAPHLPAPMQRIIDKATAKDPENRFHSCQAFKRALLGEPIVEVEVETPTKTIEKAIVGDVETAQNTQLQKRKLFFVGGGILSILLVLAIAFQLNKLNANNQTVGDADIWGNSAIETVLGKKEYLTALKNYYNNQQLDATAWKLYGNERNQTKNDWQLVDFGLNPSSENSFAALIRNKAAEKGHLVVFSFDQSGKSNLVFSRACNDCTTIQQLPPQQEVNIALENNEYMAYQSPKESLVVVRKGVDELIYEENGALAFINISNK